MTRPIYRLDTGDIICPIDEVVTERYGKTQIGEPLWQCGENKFSETEINAFKAGGRLEVWTPAKALAEDLYLWFNELEGWSTTRLSANFGATTTNRRHTYQFARIFDTVYFTVQDNWKNVTCFNGRVESLSQAKLIVYLID